MGGVEGLFNSAPGSGNKTHWGIQGYPRKSENWKVAEECRTNSRHELQRNQNGQTRKTKTTTTDATIASTAVYKYETLSLRRMELGGEGGEAYATISAEISTGATASISNIRRYTGPKH
jgi:hypothetical protein